MIPHLLQMLHGAPHVTRAQDHDAHLYLRNGSGEAVPFPWGLHYGALAALPYGTEIERADLRTGRFDTFRPRSVRVPVNSCTYIHDYQAHDLPLRPEDSLFGVILTERGELDGQSIIRHQSLYIVTESGVPVVIPPPEKDAEKTEAA